MKHIKIVDYYAINAFHEVVNLAMIFICARIFDNVVYISGKSANKNLRKLCLQHEEYYSSNISLKHRIVCEKDSMLGALFRTLLGFFITLYEYLFTAKKCVILYNYTNPLSMPIILILNIILRKNIIFMMHGELELQYKKISFYHPAMWYQMCYRFSFNNLLTKSPAYLLLLGDSIKQNIVQLYPDIVDRILTIWHPYFVDESECGSWVMHKPIRIGTVGSMKKEKGLDSLITLSVLLEKEINDNELIIESIGKVENIEVLKWEKIKWIGAKGILPREDFENYIKELDFILYLYPVDSYKLTASGAIMDAIKFQKPILYLENDYFNHLIGDEHIGYSACKVEDLAIIIRRIIKNMCVDNFQPSFKCLMKKVSISGNTSLFHLELKKYGII